MKDTDKRTDYLFKKRSFLTGAGSVIGIFGQPNKFNKSNSGEEADLKALKSDWEMVGLDLRKSILDLTK